MWRGRHQENIHRLASGGYVRAVVTSPGKHPPSGERWLRASGGYVRAVATCERWLRLQENIHRLASGGYVRAVVTCERWLRASGGSPLQAEEEGENDAGDLICGHVPRKNRFWSYPLGHESIHKIGQ